MSPAPSIILIGASKAGKSTIAAHLSKKLHMPFLDVDDVRFDYYAEIGYDHARAKEIRKAGMWALAEHWKPYDIYAIERILDEYRHGYIIAFGAGHSYYPDAEHFARAQAALEPFEYVFLVLPSDDVDEAMAILRQRLFDDEGFPDKTLDDLNAGNRHFLEHPSNKSLSTHTFINGNRTPEETCAEIIAIMSGDTA